MRSLKLDDSLISLILKYRAYQDKERERLGDKWIDTNRLFTQWNGLPMAHNAPQLFFQRLCKKTGIRYVQVHSWRHFFASSLINNGTDVTTTSRCLGHCNPSVTLNFYSHMFNEAQAKAMDAVSNAIRFNKEFE